MEGIAKGFFRASSAHKKERSRGDELLSGDAAASLKKRKEALLMGTSSWQ